MLEQYIKFAYHVLNGHHCQMVDYFLLYVNEKVRTFKRQFSTFEEKSNGQSERQS